MCILHKPFDEDIPACRLIITIKFQRDCKLSFGGLLGKIELYKLFIYDIFIEEASFANL